MTSGNDVDDELKAKVESALYRVVIPGLMAAAIFFLGFAVNKLSDHFDRIDAHLAASDTSTTVLRADVDTLKALVPQREAQIREIRDQGKQNAWDIADLRQTVRR